MRELWLVAAMLASQSTGSGCPASDRHPLFSAAALAFQRAMAAGGLSPGSVQCSLQESSELRHVVSRRLDARLLVNSLSIAGEDLQLEFADAKTPAAARKSVQLGVIAIQYRGQAEARKLAASIDKQQYFKNSKILTRLAAVAVRNDLVILFSESSGDGAVVRALQAAARSLAGPGEQN